MEGCAVLVKVCERFDDFTSFLGLVRDFSHGRWSAWVRRNPPRFLILVWSAGAGVLSQSVSKIVGVLPAPRTDDPKNESNPTARVSARLENPMIGILWPV